MVQMVQRHRVARSHVLLKASFDLAALAAMATYENLRGNMMAPVMLCVSSSCDRRPTQIKRLIAAITT
jgi:hypothetical protein